MFGSMPKSTARIVQMSRTRRLWMYLPYMSVVLFNDSQLWRCTVTIDNILNRIIANECRTMLLDASFWDLSNNVYYMENKHAIMQSHLILQRHYAKSFDFATTCNQALIVLLASKESNDDTFYSIDASVFINSNKYLKYLALLINQRGRVFYRIYRV